MSFIVEPAKNIRVIEDVDICILGGSCTGVFAAIRAARLGASVVIVEKQNAFGGVATSGLVNIWHTLYDNSRKEKIIGGLTEEILNRLQSIGALVDKEKEIGPDQYNTYFFNSEELKIELDKLIWESGVKPYLHTNFAAPFLDGGGNLEAVIVENKSGRGAIRAKVFIDATGDADLCVQLGIPSYVPKRIQPPTACAKIHWENSMKGIQLQNLMQVHADEFGLKEDWGWRTLIPGVKNVIMHAESHVFNQNLCEADPLTFSEMEGRRQIRAFMNIVRKYASSQDQPTLLSLASYIGIRETRHIKGRYRLTDEDLLSGRRFPDAIANGCYAVDIHHGDKPGVTLRHLSGVEVVYPGMGLEKRVGRWKEESPNNPTFYQIPYRCLLPKGRFKNLLACGRMVDAEEGAFSAIRVMVNTNQMGEAAGVAAYIALNRGSDVEEVDVQELRSLLKTGGSVVI